MYINISPDGVRRDRHRRELSERLLWSGSAHRRCVLQRPVVAVHARDEQGEHTEDDWSLSGQQTTTYDVDWSVSY